MIDNNIEDTVFSTFTELYASDKIRIDLLLTDPAFDFSYNAIVRLLIKTGLKKLALLKLSDKDGFEWIDEEASQAHGKSHGLMSELDVEGVEG